MNETNRERTSKVIENWLASSDKSTPMDGKLGRLIATALDQAEARGRESPRFKCKAASSSLPEPADCDWPLCGCDPHAQKVLDTLDEMGMEPKAVRRAAIQDGVDCLPKFGSEPDAVYFEGAWKAGYEAALWSCQQSLRALLELPASDKVLVPREPTETMVEAGIDALFNEGPGEIGPAQFAIVYRSMIKAADDGRGE